MIVRSWQDLPQLLEAALDKAGFPLRLVILEVLAQVAEPFGSADVPGHFHAPLLEFLQLLLQLGKQLGDVMRRCRLPGGGDVVVKGILPLLQASTR